MKRDDSRVPSDPERRIHYPRPINNNSAVWIVATYVHFFCLILTDDPHNPFFGNL